MATKFELRRLGLIAACLWLPGTVAADCVAPPPPQVEGAAAGAPPELSLAELRPVIPDCLAGIDAPNQENCSAEEIAAYADAVKRYQSALQAYVSQADRYAAESVARANAAVARAEAARSYADAVFDYATCEADTLRAATQ